MNVLNQVNHIVLPGYEKACAAPLPQETISEFLERNAWEFQLPTICVVDGSPLMRKDWASTEIAHDSKVAFISKPHGGGRNKLAQIFGIIGLIALTAIAPWAAGTLASTLGITSSIGIGLLQAGFIIGGSLLISTLLRPKAAQTTTDDSAGQVYSLTAAGNTAAPLQCIPVNYGRIKILPNYASQPWAEYIGDDQYLNMLFCLGLGTHKVHQILVDDTLLWDSENGLSTAFSDVQIEIYEPGENVDLFPVNVAQSSEVDNIELTDPAGVNQGWAGGFIINNAGTICNKIITDIGFPTGLFSVNEDDGTLQNASVQIQGEYRSVDNAGSPTSSYASLFSRTFTFNTRTPKRVSVPVDVAPGRYEVRVRRMNAPSTSSKVIDGAVWLAVRAYLTGPTSFDNVQTLAVRMRASAQLSSQSSRQIGVILTRILPVWDEDVGAFVNKPTQNAFWAFWDAASNTTYGAGRPTSKIDFAQVYQQSLAADVRGDTFNYTFTDFKTIPEAFDLILNSNRSKHLWVGDMLSCVRDEWQAVPSLLLTDNQIIRGSLNLNYIMNDEDSSDSVICQFLNEDTWAPAQLQFPPDSITFTAVKPASVQIEGVTKPQQVLNEIAFLYRQAQLRRIQITCDTEHDGRLLKLMSSIKLQSFLPRSWGLSGEVVAYNGLTNVMTVNRELAFDTGVQYYAEFRDKRGKYWGPVKVTKIVGSPNKMLIDAVDLEIVEGQQGKTLVDTLARMDGSEPPSFVFGKASNLSRQAIVLSGKPSGEKVTLNLVVDNIAVHDGSSGEAPPAPSPLPINNPSIPVVNALFASFRQNVMEPMIDASWFPAAGALGYRAQVSYDWESANPTWTQIYEGVQANCSSVVNRAALRLRVQAFNTKNGPWATFDLEAPEITTPPSTVDPDSFTPGLKDYIMNQWKDTKQKVNWLSQQIASNTAEQDAANYLDVRDSRTLLYEQAGQFSVLIQETAQIAQDLDGKLAAVWMLQINNTGYVSGLYNFNDGTTADFVVISDTFQIAAPGINGGDPVPFFQAGFSNGVASTVIGDTFIGDGVIKAIHIDVDSISAINGNMGTLTTGMIKSPDGLFVIDATNRRIEIWREDP